MHEIESIFLNHGVFSMALQIIITELEQADNFSCCTSKQTLPQALTWLNK